MASLHVYVPPADPDPDPLERGTDQAKIVRKILIPTFCDFFMTFYL